MEKDLSASKKQLRAQIAAKVRELDSGLMGKADEKIGQSLLQLPEYQQAGVVFCFVGTDSEVSTMPIILEMLRQGKQVCVPRCIGRGIMQAYAITGPDDLQSGKYGIPEPREGCRLVRPEEIDFAVIPCATCNTQGYRLGYGGGFYDRYLQDSRFTAAVICRSVLLCDDIPREPHDLRIGIVVTDQGIFRGGQAVSA